MGPVDLTPVVAWAAPILSTLVITACTALINRWIEQSKKDAKAEQERQEQERAERREWRASVDKRLAEQDKKIDTLLDLSCADTRSDIVHKCHRYLDDLGCASTEEKDALSAQHDDYKRICDANGIENHFIEQLVQRVMELPEREI